VLALPIPLAVALRGARLYAQGFALDPQGACSGSHRSRRGSRSWSGIDGDGGRATA
jgi:hypothetical protein